MGGVGVGGGSGGAGVEGRGEGPAGGGGKGGAVQSEVRGRQAGRKVGRVRCPARRRSWHHIASHPSRRLLGPGRAAGLPGHCPRPARSMPRGRWRQTRGSGSASWRPAAGTGLQCRAGRQAGSGGAGRGGAGVWHSGEAPLDLDASISPPARPPAHHTHIHPTHPTPPHPTPPATAVLGSSGGASVGNQLTTPSHCSSALGPAGGGRRRWRRRRFRHVQHTHTDNRLIAAQGPTSVERAVPPQKEPSPLPPPAPALMPCIIITSPHPPTHPPTRGHCPQQHGWAVVQVATQHKGLEILAVRLALRHALQVGVRVWWWWVGGGGAGRGGGAGQEMA